VVSVDGLLDAHEVAVRARVEELRERLAKAERDLEHAVITRQTLQLVLAGQGDVAVERVVDTAADQAAGPTRVAKPVEAGPVAVRSAGMTEAALAESYRGVWLAVRASDGGMRAGQLCRALGLGSTPAKVEGMRSKLKRLAGRGWLVEPAPGLFRVV
jgi:hypothetical protein